MFTRSMYQTEDMAEQGKLLDEVGQLVDNQTLISTCKDIVKPINAANLRKVHQRIEEGRAIGKIVLADWQ